jgi:hypothetical protein
MIGPCVSVIVINYNGRDDLPECLAALRADTQSPPFEVIVVDNASTDDSLAVLARFPEARVIANARNRGYAGGFNSAWAVAQGHYLVALNADMFVTPGWLGPLLTFLDAHPEVGAVNPLILLHAGEDRVSDCVNAAGQEVHVSGLGFNRWLGRAAAAVLPEPALVSGVQGGAVVIRRSALTPLGGWDDRGFLYHEDVELSWALQMLGHDLYCVPQAVVWHKYHLTMYPEKLFLLERNRVGMLVSHLAPVTWLWLAPFLLLTEGLMWGYCLWRGRGFLRAKWASYGWVWANRVALGQRRAHLNRLRRRTDWQLLRRMRWNYVWEQFLSLGRERGPSARQPTGGMPVKL